MYSSDDEEVRSTSSGRHDENLQASGIQANSFEVKGQYLSKKVGQGHKKIENAPLNEGDIAYTTFFIGAKGKYSEHKYGRECVILKVLPDNSYKVTLQNASKGSKNKGGGGECASSNSTSVSNPDRPNCKRPRHDDDSDSNGIAKPPAPTEPTGDAGPKGSPDASTDRSTSTAYSSDDEEVSSTLANSSSNSNCFEKACRRCGDSTELNFFKDFCGECGMEHEEDNHNN